MLFGSVPTPPMKPRSSISTQSARQSTVAATAATNTVRGLAVRNSPTYGRYDDDGEQVDAPPVGRVEVAKGAHPGRK